MSFDKEEIKKYIEGSRYAILATVTHEGGEVQPAIRTVGGFGNDGLTVYFSTKKVTPKVNQLADNPNIVAFFQHEGQESATFRNVTVIGKAKQLVSENDGDAFSKAVDILGKKNARLREQLEEYAIFKIKPRVVKALDFSRGHGPKAVEVFNIPVCCAKTREKASTSCR